jgi:UDP-N-acetylmuramoyl-L-alanyl-D-glutamate--2,6-diaminopimelate ligase
MMASRNSRNKMTLDQLLDGLIDTGSLAGIVIENLIMDSRMVNPGDLFIAIPGLTVDGRNFIPDAIEAGARAIVWESEQGSVPIPIAWRTSSSGTKVPVIAIDELTNKVGSIADRFYHEPSKQMSVIGITGTNGKTSCSHFIAQALNTDLHCGVIGTIGWGFLDNLHTSTHTTPDVITCHYWLAELLQQGTHAVAMEVSSHALDQGRVNNVHFDCAVFTNLSHEHLDYHGSLENYAAAKSKLFEVDSVKTAVVNFDDDLGKKLIQMLSDRITVLSYGIAQSNGRPDIFADEIQQSCSGLSFTLHTPIGQARIECHIFGRFNIYNMLATAGVLLSKNIPLSEIARRLSRLKAINGRLSIVHVSEQTTVVIDYAHTPDALEQALKSLREHFTGNIWCVFGCGGDRDKEKRPLMGRVASKLADYVVVTSDNPRNESPSAIIEQIISGMDRNKLVVKEDRRVAIEYALAHAEKSDIVLIAGKGHETYQQIGDMRIKFNDALIAKEILEARQK